MGESSQAGSAFEQRFLTFKAEGRLYALPAAWVSEVVRMPPIARVPQAPRSLMGLANLHGTVLPVANVRTLLGGNEGAVTNSARLLILDGALAVALAVDEVSSLVQVSSEKVRSEGTDLAAEFGEHLLGAFVISSQVIKILDIPALLRNAFANSLGRRETAVIGDATRRVRSTTTEVVRQRLMTFDVAGQEYALPLDVVREVVAVPKGLTFVPGSDDAVRGIMPYRDTLLPLLSLRKLLGLPSTGSAREEAIIVAVGNVLIGFVADRMCAVLSVDADRFESPPHVLAARLGGETQIKEICRVGPDRLVSILAPERLFREEVMQKLVQGNAVMKSKQRNDVEESRSDELQFLLFKLDDNEFALPIEVVDEVAQVPSQITRLPKTPKFLEGVVNLRGDVLPVVDQRRRFNMPSSTAMAGRRLIVVRTEQHRAALIVDSVSEVLRCGGDQIKPSPDLTGEAHGLVHSVINLESPDRIILLLDPSELLTRTERNLLDSIAKERRNKKSGQKAQ